MTDPRQRGAGGVTLPCDAPLFDLDGTLIDSLSLIEDSWREWFAALGVTAPPASRIHGRTAREIAALVVPAAHVGEAIARLLPIELEHSARSRARPGSLELLREIPPDSYAIVTSAARPVAMARIRASGLPDEGVIVTGDDVSPGKPDPAGFLEAARLLGVDPTRCVAFEDSKAGMQAARAAGCRLVAVGPQGGDGALRDLTHVRYDAPMRQVTIPITM